METTKWWAIFLVLLCTFFTSTAQLLLKAGVMKVTTVGSVANFYLLSGLLLYIIAAALLITALKFGELSVLYPAIATSFIWVNVFSALLFHEIIPFLRWVGVGFIILGITFIGIGSKTITRWRNAASW